MLFCPSIHPVPPPPSLAERRAHVDQSIEKLKQIREDSIHDLEMQGLDLSSSFYFLVWHIAM
jgi:hypothetical protein